MNPKFEHLDRVLVVGAGGSFFNNLDYARNFDGKIICVEVMAMELIKNGVIPDYITTFEVCEYVMTQYFTTELAQYSDKFTIIYNRKAKPELRNRIGRLKLKSIPVWFNYMGLINNVGLFSVFCAKQMFTANEIHMVGMDHEGVGAFKQKYEEFEYDDWVNCFKNFLPHLGDTKLINATGRGRLNFEGIVTI